MTLPNARRAIPKEVAAFRLPYFTAIALDQARPGKPIGDPPDSHPRGSGDFCFGPRATWTGKRREVKAVVRHQMELLAQYF